jgi:hypothetical protein
MEQRDSELFFLFKKHDTIPLPEPKFMQKRLFEEVTQRKLLLDIDVITCSTHNDSINATHTREGYPITRRACMLVPVIASYLDTTPDHVIKIPEIEAQDDLVVTKFIEFLEQEAMEPLEPLEKPLKGRLEDIVGEWHKKWMSMENSTLFALILLANSLSEFYLCCGSKSNQR